jgi:hypothetical protein
MCNIVMIVNQKIKILFPVDTKVFIMCKTIGGLKWQVLFIQMM